MRRGKRKRQRTLSEGVILLDFHGRWFILAVV
jgi:hypothetical protein